MLISLLVGCQHPQKATSSSRKVPIPLPTYTLFPKPRPKPTPKITGTASWYTAKDGALMANGKGFNPWVHECAMRVTHFGWIAHLINRFNGRRSWCYVEDYGPAASTGRIIDVDPAVRNDLAFSGTTRIVLTH